MSQSVTIVMIDDLPAKHSWLVCIIDYLNRSKSLGYTFTPFWGEDSISAAADSVCPGKLVTGLRSANSVFLIDLNLGSQETTENQKKLSDLLTAGTPPERAAIKEWIDIINIATLPIAGVFNKYRIATMAMLVAKKRGLPVLLVSNLASKTETTALTNAGLIRSPDWLPVFPDVEPPKDPEFTAGNDHYRWSAAIQAAVDPLIMLREGTSAWFSDESPVPHNPPTTKDAVHAHRNAVKHIFPWIPDDVQWWNGDEAGAFHEATKSFCGKYAGWMAQDRARVPFSLATMYWSFLVVTAQYYPERIKDFLIPSWKPFFRNELECKHKNLRPFLLDQESMQAEQTIRAFFEFFEAIIQNQSDSNRPCSFSEIRFPTHQCAELSLRLNWKSRYMNDLGKSTGGRVSKAFLASPPALGLPRDKASSAFLRMILSCSHSSGGMGFPGYIYSTWDDNLDCNEKGWLVFGSSQS